MPWLPDIPAVETASFTVLDGANGGPGAGQPFTVQFNPATLEYSVSNQFDDRNGNNGARQFVKKSSAKLTMTLVFDTTGTGTSVCDLTGNFAALVEPARDGKKDYAPKVAFGWGSYAFQGVVEQYKETIDFFSASGVPLRASVALTLASQQVEFQSTGSPMPAVDRQPRADPVQLPPGASAAETAQALGDPRAARAIAGASGAASLRFGAGLSLSVGGSVSLGAAADFAAGAGVGVGVGAGVGAGIGVGAGLGAGVGLDITATAGPAFAGLRIGAPTTGVSAASARAALLPAPRMAGAASFGPGGRAQVQAGGSLAADVGAGATLRGRIDFND